MLAILVFRSSQNLMMFSIASFAFFDKPGKYSSNSSEHSTEVYIAGARVGLNPEIISGWLLIDFFKPFITL